MTALRIVALIAIALGAVISIGNWLTLYFSWKHKRFISVVPIFGAALLAFGLCCFSVTRPYAWLSVVADYGTLLLLLALPTMIGEAWATIRVNLIRSFVSRQPGRVTEIRLFKKGVFTCEIKYDRGVASLQESGWLESLRFLGNWRQENSDFVLDDYSKDRILYLRPSGDEFVSEEKNYPCDKKRRPDSLTGLTFVPGKV